MRVATLFVAALTASACFADEAKVKVASHPVETAVAADQPLGLEQSAEAAADFGSVGNVHLLSNGVIIVEIPTEVYRDDKDDLVYLPGEVVAFQTPQAFQSQELRSILSLEDAAFDIQFNAGGQDAIQTGILTVTTATGSVTRFEFEELQAGVIAGPTGSVTCGSNNGSSCTQTCPPGKACIAFCSNGVANCNCVAKPDPIDGSDPIDP